MATGTKINIEVFKSVTKAVSRSEHLDIMSNHLTQLLVAAMDIKGCAIYALDTGTKELERVASFGLSMDYVAKGPILAPKSIAECMSGKPVIVSDIAMNERIQYPEEARKEGITAIVSIPIRASGVVLGTLRLYQDRPWDLLEDDLNSLVLLAEFIGLAMNYTVAMDTLSEIRNLIKQKIPMELIRNRGG